MARVARGRRSGATGAGAGPVRARRGVEVGCSRAAEAGAAAVDKAEERQAFYRFLAEMDAELDDHERWRGGNGVNEAGGYGVEGEGRGAAMVGACFNPGFGDEPRRIHGLGRSPGLKPRAKQDEALPGLSTWSDGQGVGRRRDGREEVSRGRFDHQNAKVDRGWPEREGNDAGSG